MINEPVYTAAQSMEDIARAVLSLTSKGRAEFFEYVADNVGKDEARIIMMCVSLFDMFTNERKYNIIRECVGKQIYFDQRQN